MKTRKDLMKIINIYLFITLLYYFFGRYNWEIPSGIKLLSYILILIITMNIGYYSKINIVLSESPTRLLSKKEYILSNNVRIIFKISCLSIIFFQIIWVFTFLGSFSILNVFNSLGDNYYNRLSFSNSDSVLIMQIRTLLWGLTLFAYPIGFIYFKQLTHTDKVLFGMALFIDVLSSLNMGISKNIGDIVVIYVLCILVNKKEKPTANPIIIDYIKRYRKIVILAVVFIIIFGSIQQIRDSASGSNESLNINPYNEFSTLREYTVFDFLTFEHSSIGSVIDRFGAYISHGYTGLAFALELPFENTYLLGFSRALTDYMNQFFGIDITSSTYMARIETIYGWPNGMYWPTAYTWFASAFSFWLLPIFMCFFGYILSRVEKRFHIHGDIYSLALLSQLFISAFYLPGNAQIFQARPSLFGTLLIIILYFGTGRRYKT